MQFKNIQILPPIAQLSICRQRAAQFSAWKKVNKKVLAERRKRKLYFSWYRGIKSIICVVFREVNWHLHCARWEAGANQSEINEITKVSKNRCRSWRNGSENQNLVNENSEEFAIQSWNSMDSMKTRDNSWYFSDFNFNSQVSIEISSITQSVNKKLIFNSKLSSQNILVYCLQSIVQGCKVD